MWLVFARDGLLLLCVFLLLVSSTHSVQSNSQCQLTSTTKPRLFLLSDIANEPDDAESFVRLMVYANEFRIEGLVATTSYWLNDTVRPDQMHDIVDAYGEALTNLNKHAPGWPSREQLRSLVKSGSVKYGMAGVGPGENTEGSDLLVEKVDASDEPLWIPIWGGANVLAQALWHVNATRTPGEVEKFVSKLRVYAISDQDNSGPWIRRNWPQLFYIASIHHFNRYAVAAWGGISADGYFHYYETTMSPEKILAPWIKENIQNVGPLGAKYPTSEFIVEGDTPSLLYMIPTGLSDPEYPEWGSWGGRYGPVVWGEGHFADSVDLYYDENTRRTLFGSQVTVWRWRDAYQNDFKARMQWTIKPDYKEANHAPVVVVNGDSTRNVLIYKVDADTDILLDASASCDPDGDKLSFKWWQYLEPSSNNNRPHRDVADLGFSAKDGKKITVHVPGDRILRKPGRGAHPAADKHLHIILEVSDGELVSYRRIVLTIEKMQSDETTKGQHDEL